MKVHYRCIKEQLDIAIADAKTRGRDITFIELTHAEAVQLIRGMGFITGPVIDGGTIQYRDIECKFPSVYGRPAP